MRMFESATTRCTGRCGVRARRRQLQTLNILENFDLKAMGYGSADYLHTIIEAMKLAYADRDAEIRGDGHVTGTLDETPKPVVVAALRADRSRHGNDHRPLTHAAQLREDDQERSPA